MTDRSRFWFIVALIIVGLGLYSSNLQVPFIYDDMLQIVNNEKLKNPASIADALLTDHWHNRVFAHLTFSFNWALTPNSPVSFHIVNNLLHILNSILLFLFLSIKKGDRLLFSGTFPFSPYMKTGLGLSLFFRK